MKILVNNRHKVIRISQGPMRMFSGYSRNFDAVGAAFGFAHFGIRP